jgi:hypothetical protein
MVFLKYVIEFIDYGHQNILALGVRMEKTFHFWAEWWCQEEFRNIVDEVLELYALYPLFLRKIDCQLSNEKCLAH